MSGGLAPAPLSTRFPFALHAVLLYKPKRYVWENCWSCLVCGADHGG